MAIDLIPELAAQGDVAPIARGGLAYNSGLAELADGRRMLATRVYREDLKRCTIEVRELAGTHGDWHSLDVGPMGLPQDEIAELEDCRLVQHEGRTYAAYTEGRYNRRPFLSIQRLARLRDDLTFDRAHPIAYGRNGRLSEKNWQFFSHEGRMHFVYSTNPHMVVELGRSNFAPQVEHRTAPPIHWPYGSLAGGTPPVRVGDEYVSFFHGYIPHATRHRRYVMGVYAFQAKAPFSITRLSRVLLRGTARERTTPNPKGDYWNPLVVFPAGALREADGGWTVSLGVNDTFDAIAHFSAEEIERALLPVSEWAKPRIHRFATVNPSLPVRSDVGFIYWRRLRQDLGVLETQLPDVIAELSGRVGVRELIEGEDPEAVHYDEHILRR